MRDDFEMSFQAWLGFLSSLGFAAEAHLEPPASETAIVRAETDIGFRLPDDLRALYLRADGQNRSYEIDNPAPGMIVTPFFGGYEFVPLAKAMAEYCAWEGVLDEWPSDQDAHAFITLRAGDPPVAREYWRRGWFPFAVDGGGNAYAVDLSPPPGGTYGQVILIGSDEDERRVLAPSLTVFLAKAAAQRPAIDEEHGHVRYFDMESAGAP